MEKICGNTEFIIYTSQNELRYILVVIYKNFKAIEFKILNNKRVEINDQLISSQTFYNKENLDHAKKFCIILDWKLNKSKNENNSVDKNKDKLFIISGFLLSTYINFNQE